MTYSVMGFNNYYMGGMYPRTSCCGGFNPFGFSMFSNPLYNPFTMMNTAQNLMNGNWSSMFSYSSPMSFGFCGMNYNNFGFNNYTYSNPFLTFNSYNNAGTSGGWGNFNSSGRTDNNPYFGFDLDERFGNGCNYNNNFTSIPSTKTYNKKYNFSKDYPSLKNQYTTMSKNYLNAEFLNKAKSVAKNINCDVEDLLAVMNSESGINPQQWNKSKTAVGLIQFTDIALAQLKKVYGISLSKQDVAKMSAIEQLDLAEKFYTDASKKFKGKKLSAGDLYALTYVPAFSTREVLTHKGDGYYEGNEGLDVNKDGVITKTDLNIHLAKKRVNLSTFA